MKNRNIWGQEHLGTEIICMHRYIDSARFSKAPGAWFMHATPHPALDAFVHPLDNLCPWMFPRMSVDSDSEVLFR